MTARRKTEAAQRELMAAMADSDAIAPVTQFDPVTECVSELPRRRAGRTSRTSALWRRSSVLERTSG